MMQVYAFGRLPLLSKHVIFSSVLLTIFNVVVSLFKDIPDVDGDLQNGIKTYALRFGQARIFWLCIWLLEIAYGIAIFVGLLSARSWIRAIMVTSHAILGFVLWKKANMVDMKNKKDLYAFDMFIWETCCGVPKCREHMGAVVEHLIVNIPSSNTTRAIFALKSSYKWAISGTVGGTKGCSDNGGRVMILLKDKARLEVVIASPEFKIGDERKEAAKANMNSHKTDLPDNTIRFVGVLVD
ncbi:hypothetical protein E3N88_41135 [Mikania micrantha]|uniref:Uncharacterized protein n=1 Tax=Mikania micrantha TaxID=192012 RepID=A0A5N6LRY6_9ASTR|nr:hypothetical protein E3N88_41135 [Mikania micrantha]